jgi:hypothetical protein
MTDSIYNPGDCSEQTGSDVIAPASSVQENAVPKLFVAPTVNDPTWTDFSAPAASAERAEPESRMANNKVAFRILISSLGGGKVCGVRLLNDEATLGTAGPIQAGPLSKRRNVVSSASDHTICRGLSRRMARHFVGHSASILCMIRACERPGSRPLSRARACGRAGPPFLISTITQRLLHPFDSAQSRLFAGFKGGIQKLDDRLCPAGYPQRGTALLIHQHAPAFAAGVIAKTAS